MPTGLLIALVFIPSMLLVYVVLTTCYGANRAYIAISWLPLVFILVISVFTRILNFQHLSNEWWIELAHAIRWATMVQVGLGIGLVVRTIIQRRSAVGVVLATFLCATPWLYK